MKKQITIELTDKEAFFLQQYANVFAEEQRQHGTRDPLHIVQTTYERQINGEICDCSEIDRIEYVLRSRGKATSRTEAFTDYEEMKAAAIAWISKHGDPSKKAAEVFEFGDDDYCSEIIFDGVNGISSLAIERSYFSESYVDVAYFLTKKEARKYIKDQAHNLSRPRIHTVCMSGQRSELGDLATLSELMLRMGGDL